MSFKVTKDIVGQVLKGITGLEREQVLVGIPADNADRLIDDAADRGPINNAAIGYIMENGSPAANIPARPHLKAGIGKAKDQIVGRYKSGAKALLDGKIDNAEVIHTAVGLIAENSVKALIEDGTELAPLSERTLAARRARGRTGTKPLLDTGAYRNAITHVVRPKKG